jgi:hypothetical protein
VTIACTVTIACPVSFPAERHLYVSPKMLVYDEAVEDERARVKKNEHQVGNENR